MSTATAPTPAVRAITRPNGKTYRPRTPVRVAEYVDHEERTCVIVLGTHDLDEAAALAADRWAEWYGDLDEASRPLPEGERTWMRLVPFDTGTGYDHNWVFDPVRGTACVVFNHNAADEIYRAERRAVEAAAKARRAERFAAASR